MQPLQPQVSVSAVRLFPFSSSTILLAFFLYDSIITFDKEVELFWKRRFSSATALFMANKYLYLLQLLIDLFIHNTTFVDYDNVRLVAMDLIPFKAHYHVDVRIRAALVLREILRTRSW